MKDICLKPYEKRYRNDLIKLYANSFFHSDLEHLNDNISKVLEGPDHIVMAIKEEKLIGFGSFIQLSQSQEDKKNIGLDLYWSQHPEKRNYLEDYYQEYCDEINKGQVILEYFENKFTKKNKKTLKKDIYFTHLAVHSHFRRKGLGSLLAEKRISLSKERAAENIYVHCLEKSGTEQLYSKLGFDPIIRSGPVHPNGYSSLLMGLEI